MKHSLNENTVKYKDESGTSVSAPPELGDVKHPPLSYTFSEDLPYISTTPELLL